MSAHTLSFIVQVAKLDKRNLKRRAKDLALESKRLHAESVTVKRELLTTHKRHERNYFHTLCTLVSKNHPSVTKISNPHSSFKFPKGYGKALGKALLNNTHVSSIFLDFDLFYPNVELVEHLVSFLKTSTSLRRLEMVGTPIPRFEVFVDAISANPFIQDLSCRSISPSHFCTLMTSTKSIKNLDARLLRTYHDRLHEDLDIYSFAFSKNRHLKSLKLDTSNNGDLLTNSLMHLAVSKAAICELWICIPDNTDWSLVAQFMQATPTIRDLCIDDHYFRSGMKELILGLQVSPSIEASCASTSVSKLSFWRCSFTREELTMFVAFMQTPTNDGDDRVIYKSSLRELLFYATDVIYHRTVDFTEDLVETLSMQYFHSNAKPPKLRPTIGSEVKVVSLRSVSLSAKLIDEMAQNSTHINLECLSLARVHAKECCLLTRALTRVATLRVLNLTDMQKVEGKSIQQVVENLRENGNLHFISSQGCNEAEGKNNLLRDVALRLARAYCERNKYLCKMMRTPGESDSGGTDLQPDHVSAVDQGLYPMVMHAARQVPTTYLATLFGSLLIHGGSIGQGKM
jgi:hypothetical protein